MKNVFTYIFNKHCSTLLFILFCCSLLNNEKIFAQHFKTLQTDEGIEISENGKKILFYRQQPKSINGRYERTGYIHPLYDLEEKVLTEDSPEDHPYHRGIFLAWHQIRLNKRQIADGWMSENISWKCVGVTTKQEDATVILQSQILWNAQFENKILPIVREETNITVHALKQQYRVIDFDIHLHALVDNLEIGGSDDAKGYGGFCLRLKLPNDILFTSQSKNVIPQETAVAAGPWMDITGSFNNSDSSKTGVAIFDNPDNPGPHNQWILRKAKSMQNVPYPGRTPVPLTRSGWRLQYRVIIHNNSLSNNDMEELYRQYIQ